MSEGDLEEQSARWRERVAGLAVLVLVLSLAVLVVSYGTVVVARGETLSGPASTTLATAVGGMLGIVGAYVGSLRRRPDPPAGPSQLVNRWPPESRLRKPYDQDATQELPAVELPDATEPAP